MHNYNSHHDLRSGMLCHVTHSINRLSLVMLSHHLAGHTQSADHSYILPESEIDKNKWL